MNITLYIIPGPKIENLTSLEAIREAIRPHTKGPFAMRLYKKDTGIVHPSPFRAWGPEGRVKFWPTEVTVYNSLEDLIELPEVSHEQTCI